MNPAHWRAMNFDDPTKSERLLCLLQSQTNAIQLDQDLFNECHFSVDQLMELAGLSVASVIRHCYPADQLPNRRVLIACGPGTDKKNIQQFGLFLKPKIPKILFPIRQQRWRWPGGCEASEIVRLRSGGLLPEARQFGAVRSTSRTARLVRH